MAERKRVKAEAVKAEAVVKDRNMEVADREEDRIRKRRRSDAPVPSVKRAESKPRPKGFCTIDVVVTEDIRRVITTTVFYKDGELMFTKKPVVDEKFKRGESDRVKKISDGQFRVGEVEFEVEEEEKMYPLRKYHFMLTGGSADDPNFNRDELESLIVALDGVVVRDFDRLAHAEGKHFLVAPRCLSTDKYFQCLAADFPCVSHKWILDAHEAHEKGGFAPSFETYRLPAGKDGNKLVDWEPREELLISAGIGLVGRRGFVSAWTTALHAAKASPVSIEGGMIEENGPDWPNLDCIVSEGWVNHVVVRKARLNRIPIVKEDWIIQTLIHGKKQPFEKFIAVH